MSSQSEDPYQTSNQLTVDPADAAENKVIGIVAYIIFFLPLIVAKQSRFAMYHANQGLLLLIVCLACNIVLGAIPIIGWILLPIANLGTLVLTILGIINAANGQLKPLPLIGKYTLIKTP
ncbi:Uncharacterized membrane protein [Paenibacillus sp. 1_12]|uniref:DUF4870 domain-containing protein n=1 Tax=Paenibacillus sp. 1_12 TaxID=1566278 RepID=UPI0008EA2F1B|nr:hypothetical protein [Paenibacillus sp. 1_12]SFM03237.1 Uncharacterized membrane protein [Paenibacillus sp. 1_12]